MTQCCLRLARAVKIEDLALSAIIREEQSPQTMVDINATKLRKEMEQLFLLTRGLASGFCVLSGLYLV